jgi:hypothetical protein
LKPLSNNFLVDNEGNQKDQRWLVFFYGTLIGHLSNKPSGVYKRGFMGLRFDTKPYSTIQNVNLQYPHIAS